MKKIITLLFCTALLSSAFAQNNGRDWNDNSNRNDRNYKNNTVYQNNSSGTRQRDLLIERVNRQYDFKMQQVSYNRSLNRREKKQALKSLQVQKAQQIQSIYARYNNSNVYNNGNNRDNGYKQNNDYNHYGR